MNSYSPVLQISHQPEISPPQADQWGAAGPCKVLYGHGPPHARSAWPVLVRPMALNAVGWPVCAPVWRCEPSNHPPIPGWRHLHHPPIFLGVLLLIPVPSNATTWRNWQHKTHPVATKPMATQPHQLLWRDQETLTCRFLTRLITANCATLLSHQPCPKWGW